MRRRRTSAGFETCVAAVSTVTGATGHCHWWLELPTAWSVGLLVSWLTGWLAGWIVGLRRISLRLDAPCEVAGVYLHMFASDSPRAPGSVTASAVLAQNSECIVTFLAEISCCLSLCQRQASATLAPTLCEVRHLVWAPLHTEDVKPTFNSKWTNWIQLPLPLGILTAIHITRMK